eukprot:TRINITY_DN1546_c1_g1_i1.p1 TRINITY_DN1546_c1_g1~~TRINITY_DN1546_c1_g1_i1.p1  ORF type:complete len:219 (-),score=21.89 TRINITY_DN1546_c1_g1_i1:422-1078(-)
MNSEYPSLPLKPAPLEFVGRKVRLVPLEVSIHGPALFAVTNGSPVVDPTTGEVRCPAYDPDAEVWRWLQNGPFSDEAAFLNYLRARADQPDTLAFAIFNLEEAHFPVGHIALMANRPEHRSVEIGCVWLGPVAQSRGLCKEATMLLVGHCFRIGYQRVEWNCNAGNERSRRTAQTTGFVYEGTLRQHMIVKGANRDTVWYSVLRSEWPCPDTAYNSLH